MIALLILFSFIVLTACTNAPTLTTLPFTPTPVPPISSPIPSETTDILATRNAANTQIAIDATTRIAGLTSTQAEKATLTALVPTNTPQPTFTATPTPNPTSTLVPVSESDPFFNEMQTKGYRVVDSGSIERDGFIFSAYLFREPRENEENRLESTIRETWIMAFYRWDGQKIELMRTFYPAQYNKQILESVYPYQYKIIDWDNPLTTLAFEFLLEVEDDLRQILEFSGISSDINQNGWPEFTFIAQYCPSSCSSPTVEFHFFEVRPDGAYDLAADLPGHLSYHPISIDPLVFSASEEYGYGFLSQLTIPRYFRWENDKFTEVTLEYTNQILEWVNSGVAELKSNYGQPFSTVVSELDLIRIPLVYEQLNMREQGLELFLEISDISHWPNTDSEYTCWLQFTRAQFLSEYEMNKPFTVPSSPNGLAFTTIIKREFVNYDQNKYDLSACLALIQDN